ncbi:MAG: serine hydrolase domain-containing protein [Ferruginibacter sp.]
MIPPALSVWNYALLLPIKFVHYPPVKYFRTFAFISCFTFLLFCISCNSGTKPKTVTTTDSVIILLPKPVPLSESEKQRLSYNCRLWYDSVLKNTSFNGGILVAKNGNIIFEEYKGMKHPGLHDSINATTPMHIASVSKTFTAMAVLKLAEDGKLNITDLFSKYFPQFNYEGVTIKTLLNHRSGLPNYLYFMEDLGWDKSHYITNTDVLAYLVQRKSELKNIGTPDRKFSYCNTNYVLLALLIEKISGLSFSDYLSKTFFEPLRMRNTFVFSLADTASITHSYDWRGNKIEINFLDQAYGDKNLYSTPRDLLIWDRALTRHLLLKKETIEPAYTPYSNERPGIKNYGLGWRMNVYPTGKKIIFHNGWWHGSNAVFIRLLDDDATIIVLGNRYTRAIYKASHLANIFSHYFDFTTENNTESVSPDSVSTP